MSEEIQTPQPTQEASTPAVKEVRPESIIERAEKANLRADENIKKQEDLLNRQEAIATRLLLGGRAEAGTNKTAKQTQEEEIAKRVAETLKRYK
jgi:hypothetical protein